MLLRPIAAAAVMARAAAAVGTEAGAALASGSTQAALATTSTRPSAPQGRSYHRRSRDAGQIRSMAISMQWMHQGLGLVAKDEITQFMKECFVAIDTPVKHAEIMADVLAEADHRGHFSHGLNRLEMYINDIQMRSLDPKAVPEVLNETPATAWVDGKNGLGPVVGTFCMDLAIAKAKQMGIGFVVAKGSNHYGIAGWYSLMALKHNMLGMSMTNTSPFMVPTRARMPALGTNPLSVAAPGEEDDHFCLDMATTAVAVGKIEVRKRSGDEIPLGWAMDTNGEITADPEKAMAAKSLLPLGGAENTSGYKGFGLGLMVEVLTGILAGSEYGPDIRMWGSTEEAANLGQCFMAINPQAFAPGYEGRLSDLMYKLRMMPPVDCSKPVLIPGDPERIHMEKVEKNNGISYDSAILLSINALSHRLGLDPPCIK